MPSFDQPLGASMIRAMGLSNSSIPKFLLSELERELDQYSIAIYTRFDQTRCGATNDTTGAEGSGDKPRKTEPTYCCKFISASLSPKKTDSIAVKVEVPEVGKLEVSGTTTIEPKIVNTPPPISPIPPDGCPGRCLDERVSFTIEIAYHFKLHFGIGVLDRGSVNEISFVLPVGGTNKNGSSTGSLLDISFDIDVDASDHIDVWADCTTIATDSKARRPWLEALTATSGGAPVGPPLPHAPGYAALSPHACKVKVTGNLMGPTSGSDGWKVTVDMTARVGTIPQIPPPAAFPVKRNGAITPKYFPIWEGDVPGACGKTFAIDATFDVKLVNSNGGEEGTHLELLNKAVECPKDSRMQYISSFTLGGRASLLLYVKVEMSC